MVKFPLRLPDDLHEAIHLAAFNARKSKHQFILDAIRKELESAGVQVSNIPKSEDKESD